MLEQVQMNDRYKLWVDECSKIFGGLDVLVVEAIQGKDGKEYIIGVNDSAMTLLGETQEEDRKLIAELTLSKMQATLKPVHTTMKSSSNSSVIGYTMNGNGSSMSLGSVGSQSAGPSPSRPPQGAGQQPRQQPDPRGQQGQMVQQQQMNGRTGVDPRQQQMNGPQPQGLPHAPLPQQQQQQPGLPHAPTQQQQQRPQLPREGQPRGPPPHNMVHRPPPPPMPGEGHPPQAQRQLSRGQSKEGEDDTMKNLRKTFAGIFGDM